MESNILPENQMFADLRGYSVLVVMQAQQLNLLGQTFRPIICGTVTDVTNGYVTIAKPNIKMFNAPHFVFPTPLHLPIEKIANIMRFNCNTRLSLT